MPENPINYNDTLPAAPGGKVNVKWQADTPDPDPTVPRNVSAYVDISAGGGGSDIVVSGGEAAPQLSARLLGTQIFKSNNASLSAWTQQTGTHATVDATYNLGGNAYDVIAGAIISVDAGHSLADCAIDFDFLSPAGGGITEFLFGQSAAGAGPLIQMDGRGGGNAWSKAASSTWGNFTGVATGLGFISDFQTRQKQWNHVTLIINVAGTAAALYFNGILVADAIAITLSGTYIGFWSLATFGDLEVKDVIVTDLSTGGTTSTLMASYDGSSLTGWTTNGTGVTIDSNSKAFYLQPDVSSLNYMHRDVNVTNAAFTTFLGSSIEFDFLNNPDGVWGETTIWFGCNSTGSGLQIQLTGSGDPANNPTEIYSTTDWHTWNWVSTARHPTNYFHDRRWYHAKVVISLDGTTVTLYVDGAMQHKWTTCKNGDAVSTFSNKGTHIGSNGDSAGSGAMFRNLVINQP